MSVAAQDRQLVLGTGHGGMSARRAVVRWAWRLFRREWRQQSLVLALLLVAAATTTAGLALAANTPSSQGATFGTADHLVTWSTKDTHIDDDIAALRGAFGTVEVIRHQAVPVPGSANAVDLRAQDPNGPYSHPMLRLDSGRYPRGPNEIAVTDALANIFKLRLGGSWDQGGRRRTVVGLVENPLNLRDRFALVAPDPLGTVTPAEQVTVMLRATAAEFASKQLPDGASIEVRSDDGSGSATVAVLLMATVGLLFVGLVAVAGFTVMAQRRLRALGMLAALGAGRRHIRLVLVANGAVIGAVGASAGAALGLAAWFAAQPWLESSLGHRIDRFNLPWLPLLAAVLLTILTAVCAAWWPARAAARVSVVSALSSRPVPPRPAYRFTVLGLILLVAGLGSLVAARQTRPLFIIGGVVGTVLGLLLLAPVGIAGVGRLARSAPLAPRLALRDLARYRARSSAALAAIGLAVGIAATIALAGAVTVAKAAAPTGGNLPADQIVVWLSPNALRNSVPVITPAQVNAARLRTDAIATSLHASPALPLQAAVDPDSPIEHGGRYPILLGIPQGGIFSNDQAIPLFIATPELLSHYAMDPTSIDAATDVVTSRTRLDGYVLFPGRYDDWRPRVQHAALPTYTSLPTALLTARAVQTLHLRPIPAGWLIQAPHPLTQTEIDRAQQQALTAGLSVETRPTGADTAALTDRITAIGIALALGVLAMTVGLIRSETARDLRTLTAAGARRGTRRALTAATAGALALLGAILGTAGAYLAMLAWYHHEPHWLGHPPVLDLAAILIGLPVIAYAGGWRLAGQEPATLTRQPLE